MLWRERVFPAEERLLLGSAEAMRHPVLLVHLVCLGMLATASRSRAMAEDRWILRSPDSRVELAVRLADLGGEADYPSGKRRLYYDVSLAGDVVLRASPLGIVRRDRSFVDGLELESAGPVKTLEGTYELLSGKRRRCREHFHEQVLSFRGESGGRVELILRVADDGVAFRYRFPETDARQHTVQSELTGFRLREDARITAHPYDRATTYSPAYETYYENSVTAGTPSPSAEGWAFPVLFRSGPDGPWGLISEAALDRSYCGSRLGQSPSKGVYRLRFPDAAEGNGTGSPEPKWTLPWRTPWRLVIVAPTAGGIAESTLVTDLSPPTRIEDTSWIRPGRASWSWLSDHDSPQDFEKLRRFVDLAAQMHWEYSLVDANWTVMRNGTIHDLAKHAKSKGVGLLLWYNSGGPHNVVTEKPRGLMFHREVRRKEFELLNDWGVRGVKVDFFQSDKQNVIGLYHDILEDAADYRIMVNFHGCTLPRGESRTHPHLMTSEAVKGAECYSFDPKFPARAPRHNTTVPFTRNVVGSMDYTPVMLRDNVHPFVTTHAHELALGVVFESGWLHFADCVEAYGKLAEVPREFLRRLPTAWDATRCLRAEPGQYAVFARRRGENWYVGGLNGEARPRSDRIELAFLPAGTYSLTLITDGDSDRDLRAERREVEREEVVPLELRPHGGFAMELAPVR